MTLQFLVFLINIITLVVLTAVLSVIGPQIKYGAEKRFIAFLYFVMVIICTFTIFAYYKITTDINFLTMRGLLQPIIMIVIIKYLIKCVKRKENEVQ